jgi:hypothetical protein
MGLREAYPGRAISVLAYEALMDTHMEQSGRRWPRCRPRCAGGACRRGPGLGRRRHSALLRDLHVILMPMLSCSAIMAVSSWLGGREQGRAACASPGARGGAGIMCTTKCTISHNNIVVDNVWLSVTCGVDASVGVSGTGGGGPRPRVGRSPLGRWGARWSSVRMVWTTARVLPQHGRPVCVLKTCAALLCAPWQLRRHGSCLDAGLCL